ncbi:hypothetical protein K9L63_03540 [Candidatus Gracilibacteria bacterium]|nr:hypothetical protein [Candidatus Gracilibacteria bacterium]
MNLSDLRTASGKTIKDFKIPQALLDNDTELVELVMLSGSMNDGEKQYWFNLTEVMNPEQIQKLRDILLREKRRISEIDLKYKKKNENPEEAMERAQSLGEKRTEEQQRLLSEEKKYEEEEKAEEEAVLEELQKM